MSNSLSSAVKSRWVTSFDLCPQWRAKNQALSGIVRLHPGRLLDRLDVDVSEARRERVVFDLCGIGVGEGSSLHIVKWLVGEKRTDGVLCSFGYQVQLKLVECD